MIITENVAPGVFRLTLNRPEAANALNQALAEALAEAVRMVATAARVVVLTGAGEKAFCAGADIKERAGMDAAAWHRQHAALEAAVDAVVGCGIPVIAVVQGAAYGGGLELALACDIILASTNARFALTEASLGIMPGLGGITRLPEAVGERTAKAMLFTAAPIGALEACACGLVYAVHAPDQLQEEAIALARSIAANAPLALRAIKRALRGEDARALYTQLIDTRDRAEGTAAFLARRPPEFTGS